MGTLAAAVRAAYRTGPAATDRELLGRYAAGDEAAFRTLFDRHAALVLGVCRRALSSPSDAEDALQATFLVLARKAAGRWHPSVAHWLHATARKVARNARVAAARRHTREQTAAVPERVDPVDQLSARELLLALDAELARLPDRYRGPLVLCYLEGLTRDEAARRLGLSAGAVKINLERGRKRLAAALARRGFAPGGVLLAAAVASPAGAVAPRLADSVAAALAGHPTAAVAALAQGLTMTTPKLAAVALILVAGIAAGASLFAGSAAPPAPPPPVTPPAPPAVVAATDAHGDPLPPGALTRLGTVRFRVGMWSSHIAASPDGAKLAATGHTINGPEHLTVWDAATGRPLRDVPYRGGEVATLAWTPDGRGLAVMKTGAADYAVWEFTDPAAKVPLGKHEDVRTYTVGTFNRSEFSPDGKWLAAGVRAGNRLEQGRVKVWPVKPGPLPIDGAWSFDSPGPVVGVHYTPDGKQLVCVTEKRGPDKGVTGPMPGPVEGRTASVRDAATGKELRACEVPVGEGFASALGPDGSTLFVATGGRVTVLDLGTGRARLTWEVAPKEGPHDRPADVTGLLAAPDGRAVLVVERHIGVSAFDPATGRRLGRDRGPEARNVMSLGRLPDGKRFAAGTNGGELVFGDLAAGKMTAGKVGHRGWVAGVVVAADGRTATTVADDGVHRWDLATGKELGTVPLGGDGFTWRSVRGLSPDGRSVLGVGSAADSAWALTLADAGTGRPTGGLSVVDGGELRYRLPTWSTAWVGGGPVVLDYEGKTARRVGPDGKPGVTYTPTGEAAGVDLKAATASPDGRTVALVGWARRPGRGWLGVAAVFDAATGRQLRAWTHPVQFKGVSFTPDGKTVILTGSPADRPRPPGQPAPPADPAAPIILCPVDRDEATCPFDGRTTAVHADAITPTVAPNGYQLAVADIGHAVTVYELATGAIRRRLIGHRNEVHQLAFTPDGKRLVSVGADGTGLVWDVGPPTPAKPVAFTDADRLKRWEALRSDDIGTAERARGELAADPAGTVALARERLKPTPPPTDAAVDELVAKLGADAFADREAAAAALDRLGRDAVRRARERQADATSAEVRRRLGDFLAKYEPHPDRLSGARLGERRAVELLEGIGTPEAVAVLRALADDRTPLGRDAAAAVGRLKR